MPSKKPSPVQKPNARMQPIRATQPFQVSSVILCSSSTFINDLTCSCGKEVPLENRHLLHPPHDLQGIPGCRFEIGGLRTTDLHPTELIVKALTRPVLKV